MLRMLRHGVKKRAIVPATALALAGLALPGGAIAAHAAATSQQAARPFTLVTATRGMVQQQSVINADGTATARWRAPDGTTVTVNGMPGGTVQLRSAPGKHGGITAEVSSGAINKNNAAAVAKQLSAFKRGPQSIYTDALSTGMSPAQAASISSQVIPAAPIENSLCINLNADIHSGKPFATEHFCDIQYLDQASGANWYLSDEMTGTGRDTYFQLYQEKGANYYGSGNTVVKWDPTGKVNRSSCGAVTFSLTYNGVGVSSTADLCPNYIDPWLNPKGPGFGEIWYGSTHDYVGLNPVDVIHDPPAASPALHLLVAEVWGP
jgi:hypothetical protein